MASCSCRWRPLGWHHGMAGAYKDPMNNTRRGRVLFALDQMAAGLLFGILLIFQWRRAFHQPLVYITAAAAAGMFISGSLVRRQKHKEY